jgi:hypothetical protein
VSQKLFTLEFNADKFGGSLPFFISFFIMSFLVPISAVHGKFFKHADDMLCIQLNILLRFLLDFPHVLCDSQKKVELFSCPEYQIDLCNEVVILLGVGS